MSALGTKAFRDQLQNAQEKGRESGTVYGHSLLVRAIIPIRDGIRASIADMKSGKPGRSPIAAKYLEQLDAETAAFLAAKWVLDGITTKRRLQNAAISLAQAFEDEVRFRAFAAADQTDPVTGETRCLDAYVRKVRDGLNAQTSHYGHKRKVMVHSMTAKGVAWEEWSKSDKLHLGLKLIEIVEATTQVVERVMLVSRNKKEYYLAGTEVTLEWIKGKTAWAEVLCPRLQPMLIPPKDWESPVGGGYLRSWGPSGKLVKTRSKLYLEELFASDLNLVYSSLNAIQRTAWKVNPDVLKALTETWRATNHTIGDLPGREDEPKPAKPVDIETNKDARKLWRRAASAVVRSNQQLGSKRLMVDSTIRTAEKFKDEAELYFPYNLDFRGRVYSIPSGLNPQGHDIAKGLLSFAHGKALGDERAADWLAIHGANTFGFDKVSLEDRVNWVRENQHHIVGSAEAPLDYLWWEQADKPWQFLAFCFEWVGYLKQGLAFVSCLPIALDGSCNGLQHFSAMLRDPIGGAAVNLTPSDKPQDIYQTVADRLIEKLKADGCAMALAWLAFGITRKITKRPVMVVPYGGTRHSCRDYIIAAAKEHMLGIRSSGSAMGDVFRTESELFAASNYLAGLLWDAIGETVVAARDAMDWLQKVSQVVSKEDKPLNWTAPSGFKVQQNYPNVKSRTVKTQIAGALVYMNLREDLDSLDKRRQAQGISPNFVHSLDAAALTFTVDAAAACGIEAFSMIHDSYGTLAADTDTLRECLRQAFCQMYQFDVLENFRNEIQAGLPDGVELPPLPKKGSLDINQVLQSDFFFA